MHPVLHPSIERGLWLPQFMCQILRYPQIVQQMDVAGDHLHQSADLHSCGCRCGQQGRFGPGIFQIFQDCQGLAHCLIAMSQGGDQVLWVERGIAVGMLLATILSEVNVDLGIGQLFEVQANADPVGGA